MQSDSLKSEKGGKVKVAHISLIAVSAQLGLQRDEGSKAETVCEDCEGRALVIYVLPAVIG